jgi:CRISPR/Cas system-associated protein Cas7 (RAMP superfamily)
MQVRMASISQNLANKVNYNNPIQVPFNKEIASTTYSFIFNLDADKVCVNSYTNSQICDDRTKVIRVNLALDALKLVIDGNFGASKSRFNPFIEKEIIVATVTKGDVLFTVSSPAMKLEDFINETIERAIAYTKEFNKLRISIYVWANKGRNITVNGKSIKNYIEELKKNNTQSNLTIEYIESYSHSDLIEKLKAEVKIEAKQ